MNSAYFFCVFAVFHFHFVAIESIKVTKSVDEVKAAVDGAADDVRIEILLSFADTLPFAMEGAEDCKVEKQFVGLPGRDAEATYAARFLESERMTIDTKNIITVEGTCDGKPLQIKLKNANFADKGSAAFYALSKVPRTTALGTKKELDANSLFTAEEKPKSFLSVQKSISGALSITFVYPCSVFKPESANVNACVKIFDEKSQV